MKRQTEELLFEFCAKQKSEFSSNAWIDATFVDKKTLCVVALFLSGVNWFGHESNLFDIAKVIDANCSGKFPELAKEIGFDCGRFSNMLQMKIKLAGEECE